MPVYDPDQRKYIGFVDYNDVIELIIECYRTRPASGKISWVSTVIYQVPHILPCLAPCPC